MLKELPGALYQLNIASDSGLALLAILPAGIAKAEDSSLLTPIDPADLKLTDNPKEPGGQAMVLDY